MLDVHGTLKPLVDRAVKQAHSDFPEHHDHEDTEQAVWVWVYEKMNTVQDVASDGGRLAGALYPIMLNVARTHLRGEDQASYGYSRQDAFEYSRELLESILEMVFVYEDWQSFAIKLDSQPRSKSQVNESGNQLAQYADVKSAVEKLPEDQYNVIVWRHKLQYTFEAIGIEVGISRQAARERWDRAVGALQRSLGEKPLSELRGGHGGRQGLSTAEANATTERDWNG